MADGVVGRALWGMDASPLYRSIAQLGSAENVTIVDAPCGGGVALRALKPDQDVRYIAVDASPKMIGRAKRRARKRALGQIEFAVADMTKLPLRTGQADVVVCYSGLHMLADPREALAEFARCLRPGGLLTGTTFLVDDLSRRARALFELGARRGHAMPPGRDELFSYFAEAGFCEHDDRVHCRLRRVQRPTKHERDLALALCRRPERRPTLGSASVCRSGHAGRPRSRA